MADIRFHAVFIATSTPEKVRDLNIVAEAKRLPMKFFRLNELAGTMHNTLEDGDSAQENSEKKLMGAAKQIERFRKDPVAVREFLLKRGLDCPPDRIWFGAEDSGVTLPKEIWDNIPQQVFSTLPDEVSERLGKQISGPGVDTAPFLSATLGTANISNIVEQGMAAYVQRGHMRAKEADENYVPDVPHNAVSPQSLLFREECVISLQQMQPESGEINIPLIAKGTIHNRYADTPYVHPDPVGGQTSNFALVMPRRRNPGKKTAAELGLEYIGRHSARSAAVDDLARQIHERAEKPENKIVQLEEEQKNELITGLATRPDQYDEELKLPTHTYLDMKQFPLAYFNVGIVGGNSATLDHELSDRSIHAHQHSEPHLKEAPLHLEDPTELANWYLSWPDRLLKKNDGLILMSDSMSAHPMKLEDKLYLLQSLVVAKQLIPRDMNKQITIINTDHSWDDAIRIHAGLARVAMTKDNAISMSPKLQGVCEITSNSYFDTINKAQSDDAALQAAALLMKERSHSYHRTKDIPPIVSREGTAPEHWGHGDHKPAASHTKERRQKDKVAIFCSASNENSSLNRFVSDIAYKLVEKGKGIICGGGDRYTMGAILLGVELFRQTLTTLSDRVKKLTAYIAGYSTHPIAASETNEGVMPESYSYRELTTDIYERMAKMMVNANTIMVAPGGAGTIQEWMGFNLLQRKMPEIFRKKKLVVFDPDLLANPEHAAIADEVVQRTSSFQNRVFDKVLDIAFHGETMKYRLNRNFNSSGISIVSSVDEAVSACDNGYSRAV